IASGIVPTRVRSSCSRRSTRVAAPAASSAATSSAVKFSTRDFASATRVATVTAMSAPPVRFGLCRPLQGGSTPAAGASSVLTTETACVLVAIVPAVEPQTWAASLPGSPDGLARAGVTEREREVLALLVARLTNREIAERLGRSVRTVESHVSALLGKLGLHDRVSPPQSGPRLRRGRPPAAQRLPKPMSSFVGRQRELGEVEELLAATAMVTLVGAPGIGK